MYVELVAREYRQKLHAEAVQARLVRQAQKARHGTSNYERSLVWLGQRFIQLGESLQRPYSTLDNAPYVFLQGLAR